MARKTSIGVDAAAPYRGYTVYRVFHKAKGRFFAVLVSPGHRTTIPFAKYVLETSLGRVLLEGHEAHHKDHCKTNDAVENLEEKPRNLHRREHNAKPIRHGTTTGYWRGCRCDECRTAASSARQALRLRSAA